MTDDSLDLSALSQCADQATSVGTWQLGERCEPECSPTYMLIADEDGLAEIYASPDGDPRRDAEYIVAACNALPKLVARVRALQARVQEVEIKSAQKLGTIARLESENEQLRKDKTQRDEAFAADQEWGRQFALQNQGREEREARGGNG